MKNKIINIIRPASYSAEYAYLKEFFRFIGCFFTDSVISPYSTDDFLKPTGEEGSVDILLNFFGEDPYRKECTFQGIKRIYCYLCFDDMYAAVSKTPLQITPSISSISSKRSTKPSIRKGILTDLINEIWNGNSQIQESIHYIASLYTDNSYGDLFFYLQARRGLRVLSMGEVLKVTSITMETISLSPYIFQTLESLWEIYVSLEDCMDVYSVYTQVRAMQYIRDIVSKIHETDYRELQKIEYNGRSLELAPPEKLSEKLRSLIRTNPDFLSAYLSMASICRKSTRWDDEEENCYFKILQSVTADRKEYAFIWYRIGYYYEKKYHDTQKSLEYYQIAAKTNPEYYQALFKLGQYAAAEGQFHEAEAMLKRTILAVFHGISPDADENGRYDHWEILSMKECQYVFKAYVLLAKIAINSNREYSAKAYMGKACIAATCFEEVAFISKIATPMEMSIFGDFHSYSEPVWAMWQVLKPWYDGIIQDDYVKNIVYQRLSHWN